MWTVNEARVNALVGDGLVLDVGGWTNPWPRADYVIDLLPYETRTLAHDLSFDISKGELLHHQKPGERFSKRTWIVHDICGDQPWPFPDKTFDFIVCSQMLEDVRDPIRACAEMIRVGKAGYIETPSRLMEHVRGIERAGMAGYCHHRWLVELEGATLSFRHKPHLLHTRSRYYVPLRHLQQDSEQLRYNCLFWTDTFSHREVLGYEFYSEAEAFVRALGIARADYLSSAAIDAYRQVRARLLRRRVAEDRRWNDLFALSQSIIDSERSLVSSRSSR